MNQKELKVFVFGFIIAAIGVAFVASNFSVIPSATVATESSDSESTITYHAMVCKKVTRTDGTVEDLGCSKNLFMHSGMNYTANQLSGSLTGATNSSLGTSTGGIVNVIAIGVRQNKQQLAGAGCEGAVNATELFLCGEHNTSCGLGRAAGDAVRVNVSTAPSAGNWTITREFTSTCNGVDVNVTGLFNSTTNDTSVRENTTTINRYVFFAQNTFTTATLQNNDKINVTWFIWVS